VLAGHRDTVRSLAWSPDGKALASCADSFDGTVRVWDAATGKASFQCPAQFAGVHAVAFSPDGKTVAAGELRTVHLYDASTGRTLRTWQGHEHQVNGLAFSPDGKALATASFDQTAALWDVATGAERQRYRGHDGYVAGVAFRPDGRLLATASWDKTVRFWDAATGTEVGRLPAGRYGYERVEFSPDGRWVAVAGHDRGTRLWEVATGQELLCLPSSTGFALTFSPDGRTLATAERDGTVLLWDVAGGVFGKPDKAARPGAEELQALAKDLGGANAAKAYRAAGRLLAVPRQAVPLLGARLRPEPPDPARQKEIARLIDDLDADDFEAREKASARLGQLGEAAEPALRKVLAGRPSQETRVRAERLLGKISAALVAPLAPAQLRALTVLERLGTPEAREALKGLAEAPAGGALAAEAKAALGRLTRHP
jgi:DNA-binding beta-propeller fold protein YncE